MRVCRLVAVLNGGEREAPKRKVLTALQEDELITQDADIVDRLKKILRIAEGAEISHHAPYLQATPCANHYM